MSNTRHGSRTPRQKAGSASTATRLPGPAGRKGVTTRARPAAQPCAPSRRVGGHLVIAGQLASAFMLSAAIAAPVLAHVSASASAPTREADTAPTRAALTADAQQSPPASSPLAVQPPPTDGTPAPGSTPSWSLSDWLNAAGTRVQGAASSVGQVFSDAMTANAEAEIAQAQAQTALAKGVIDAFPYAWQEAGAWSGDGLDKGLWVGGVVGTVGGGIFGSPLGPAGTLGGAAGGAIVGGDAGLVLGATLYGAAGFIDGMIHAPTWSAAAPAEPAITGTIADPVVPGSSISSTPGTGFPTGLYNELGLGGIGQPPSPDAGAAGNPWTPSGAPAQPAPGTRGDISTGTNVTWADQLGLTGAPGGGPGLVTAVPPVQDPGGQATAWVAPDPTASWPDQPQTAQTGVAGTTDVAALPQSQGGDTGNQAPFDVTSVQPDEEFSMPSTDVASIG